MSLTSSNSFCNPGIFRGDMIDRLIPCCKSDIHVSSVYDANLNIASYLVFHIW